MNRYSQHGEDVFINDFIQKHNINATKLIVDIGAYDGKFISNSLAFIEDGWYGILIEPHPESFEKLKELHLVNPFVICVKKAVTKETGDYFIKDGTHLTLSEVSEIEGENTIQGISFKDLVEQYGIKEIGIISIDTEGFDTAILQDAIAYHPEFIIIESNELSERSKQIEILNTCYYLIGTFDVNTVWVKKQLMA